MAYFSGGLIFSSSKISQITVRVQVVSVALKSTPKIIHIYFNWPTSQKCFLNLLIRVSTIYLQNQNKSRVFELLTLSSFRRTAAGREQEIFCFEVECNSKPTENLIYLSYYLSLLLSCLLSFTNSFSLFEVCPNDTVHMLASVLFSTSFPSFLILSCLEESAFLFQEILGFLRGRSKKFTQKMTPTNE